MAAGEYAGQAPGPSPDGGADDLPAWAGLGVVPLAGLGRSGPVAVAGLAACTFVRQFIIGMRAEPRRWKHGRRVTAAAALIASVVLLAVR